MTELESQFMSLHIKAIAKKLVLEKVHYYKYKTNNK